MTDHAPRPTRPGRSAARTVGLVAAGAVLLSAGCASAGSVAAPAATRTAATTPTAETTPITATTPTIATTVRSIRSAGGRSPAATAAAIGTRAATTTAPTAVTAVTGRTGATGAMVGLPPGLTVDAISAVSTRNWWVLGTGGSGSLALARTTDGGRSWTVPLLPSAMSRPVTGGQQSPGLAFATAADGSLVTGAGAYWVTGDGGAHWRAGNPAGAPVTAVAATADASLALLHTAAGFALARGAAGTVGLTTVLTAGRLTTTTPAVATSGRTVVVVSGDRTLVSTDDGRTFRTVSGPCTADLGGQVSVAASTVVAWCATGMDGSGWISTDGGRHFAAVAGAEGANATAAAPTGSGGALVWADPVRGVHLRTAAGSTTSGHAMYRVGWLGFTTAADGFAIAGASATGPAVVWHTADGGRSWAQITLG